MTASTDGTSRSVSDLTRTTPRSGSTRTGTSAPESRMVARRMGGLLWLVRRGRAKGACEGVGGSVGADEAAVDADLLAGEVAGLLGREEGDDRAELGRRAVTAG